MRDVTRLLRGHSLSGARQHEESREAATNRSGGSRLCDHPPSQQDPLQTGSPPRARYSTASRLRILPFQSPNTDAFSDECPAAGISSTQPRQGWRQDQDKGALPRHQWNSARVSSRASRPASTSAASACSNWSVCASSERHPSLPLCPSGGLHGVVLPAPSGAPRSPPRTDKRRLPQGVCQGPPGGGESRQTGNAEEISGVSLQRRGRSVTVTGAGASRAEQRCVAAA